MTVLAPHLLSATQAVALIKARQLTATELLEACLVQIDHVEPQCHAWVHVAADQARVTAQHVDQAIRQGDDPGPLAGIPLGIKDIFNTADMPTQMGSPIWANFIAGNDARVVSSLRWAGGIVLGKTVTAEFAVHTPGPTVNPHHPAHAPGTSSSGSAVAVASSMVPLALGSQTAGSVIRPASYCGVYGMKPSFGLLPRTGSLKTTDSLDTIGFFARTLEDLALVLHVLRVHGPDYPISHAALTDPSRRKPADRPWQVAMIRGPKWSDAEPYARAALVQYANTLDRIPEVMIEEAELPAGFDQAHHIHSVIYDKTLAHYFKAEFQQGTLVSPALRAMIEHGQQITLEDYQAALIRQAQLAQALDQWFAPYDVLLTLSTGGEAMKGLQTPDRPDACLIWTLCGVPAVNVPVFVSPAHLPFGAQLVARKYHDLDLLRFCQALRRLGLAPEGTNPPLAPAQQAMESDVQVAVP